MRILAVDPGERHIGLAISDPGGTIARPLTTLKHAARQKDAAEIAALAAAHGAGRIVVGVALDAEGEVGPQARRAQRLADAIRLLTSVPVVLHDESQTSATARQALRAGGKSRRARRTLEHAAAAAVILQQYLNERPPDE